MYSSNVCRYDYKIIKWTSWDAYTRTFLQIIYLEHFIPLEIFHLSNLQNKPIKLKSREGYLKKLFVIYKER